VRPSNRENRVAKRVEVLLIDDLDGTDASESVRFSLDGTSYEIDLSAQNAEDLRLVLDAYVSKARKVANSANRRRNRR
jgi:hypothetical protein